LADFDESRNRAPAQALNRAMNFKRPIRSTTNGSTNYLSNWTDFPPTQAGLVAALRRAFEVPPDETSRKFEELIRNLS